MCEGIIRDQKVVNVSLRLLLSKNVSSSEKIFYFCEKYFNFVNQYSFPNFEIFSYIFVLLSTAVSQCPLIRGFRKLELCSIQFIRVQ
jgi:hypothetical protein